MLEAIKNKMKMLEPEGGYKRPVDFGILAQVTALVIFGVVMVFSSSYYYSLNSRGTPFYFLGHQAVYAVVGFAMMLFFAKLDYHKLVRWTPLAMIGSFVLLVLVFFVGLRVNNATRWIALGPITLMPGEITKIAIIMFTAAFLAKDKDRIYDFFKGIVPVLVVTGIYAGMIVAQPNLSTAITVVVIAFGMMFLAGLKYRYIFISVIGGIAGIIGLSMSGVYSHWQTRLTSYQDPFENALGEGFQVAQSLLALGTGGLFGLGLGKSVQKNLYLPEPMNDFILSIIGEELGFVGIMILMGVFLVFLYRVFRVSMNAPDRYGMLLAGGVGIMIGVQVIFNIAVITSSMPPTGIALPFISYGGNALWICMSASGVVMNVSRQCVFPEPEENAEGKESEAPGEAAAERFAGDEA